jgi:hypothetical protein
MLHSILVQHDINEILATSKLLALAHEKLKAERAEERSS